ncbi:MAG: divergent polysaccharide deacetylase family protein [Bacteroidota bacterium]
MDVNRETRRFVALYFLFTVFLFASAAEMTAPPVPAAAGRLETAGKSGAEEFGRALSSSLSQAGFVLTRPSGFDRLTLTPRTGYPPLIWTTAADGDARELLARAAAVLAGVAARHEGLILSTRWSSFGGWLCLHVRLRGKDAVVELRLQAALRRANPLGLLRRTAVPKQGRPPDTGRPAKTGQNSASRPRVAIVLDDVGFVGGTEDFLALPAQLTFAILPLGPYARTYARQAASAGRTVILHLPLEPLDTKQNPGPGVIRTGATGAEIRAQLEANLGSVPGAVGVNNHMGSLGTTDETLMLEIQTILKEKGLFFLDSRTFDPRVKKSVVGKVARHLGERFAERDYFLDPEGASVEEIRALLRQLIDRAKKHGSAIGICHANRPNTLAALKAALPEFAASGVEIVPVTELLHY